jgi:hypothetical protein
MTQLQCSHAGVAHACLPVVCLGLQLQADCVPVLVRRAHQPYEKAALPTLLGAQCYYFAMLLLYVWDEDLQRGSCDVDTPTSNM